MNKTFLLKNTYLIHLLGWLLFYLSAFLEFPFQIVIDDRRIYMHSIFVILMMIVFYIVYFILFRKFFKKKMIFIFVFIVVSLVITLSISVDIVLNTFVFPHTQSHSPSRFKGDDSHKNITMSKPDLKPMRRPSPKKMPFQGVLFFSVAAILAISIRSTEAWLLSEKERQQIENDKLKAELGMLKAQINPHFFFNVMNNLCSLARKKSDKTEEYIIKLSQIMRHSFTNVNHSFIPISQEIEFIQNYVEVCKLSYSDDAKIDFFVEGDYKSFMIAPMILFSFVENAFKHSNISKKSDFIITRIVVDFDSHTLFFESENTYNTNYAFFQNQNTKTGIVNTQKRLLLIYPDKHQLIINQDKNMFKVNLKIDLL